MAHVLLIDDDRDLVAVNRGALEAKGFRVSTASSGDDGWVKLQKDPPDLVVLDGMMESFTAGFELAHDMNLKYPRLPILMLTSIHEHMRSDWNWGPADKGWLPITKWMEKPVSPSQLISAIDDLLKASQANRN